MPKILLNDSDIKNEDLNTSSGSNILMLPQHTTITMVFTTSIEFCLIFNE